MEDFPNKSTRTFENFLILCIVTFWINSKQNRTFYFKADIRLLVTTFNSVFKPKQQTLRSLSLISVNEDRNTYVDVPS